MIGEIARYNSIGQDERDIVEDAMGRVLSGFLAGQERGGFYVCELEDAWCEVFGVKHAIACNSATSGLLAAAFAIGLSAKSQFVCPAMTMSATVAAPMFTGATPIFVDVDDESFSFAGNDLPYEKDVVVTNLFGHPGDLRSIRKWCDLNQTFLIEDSAQSPFAMEHGKYAGTIGHIGVFSLNVHKHFHCGEGGMIVTNDDSLAEEMRCFINHGENANRRIGLNLRMPEVSAAIGFSQLRNAEALVQGRIDQAEAILAAIGPIPGLRPPVVREGCTHVYYAIPFLIDLRSGIADGDTNAIRPQGEKRAKFCAVLRDLGVPIVEAYASGPLYRMPAFARFDRSCPIAEDLHDERLLFFENCAWSPTDAQIKLIGDAFKKAAEQCL